MHIGAKWIVTSEGVLEGATVEVQDGKIVGFGAGEADLDVGNVALMPGLVNTHSHAFQRAIRGRTERRNPKRKWDDFWTWREQMYTAALSFSRDDIYAVSRAAFLEMALSGITTVGEFHYVHHRPDGVAYDDPNELANTVIAAARSVGLRIALLRVAYAQGGPGKASSLEQRRFVESTPSEYLARLDDLAKKWEANDFVSVGTAPHSVRAVRPEWLSACADWAENRDAVLHIHACEQRAEVEECREAYGVTPVELLRGAGVLSERATVVHATHLSEHDLEILEEYKPTVCACPTTERNLGDGFLPARQLVSRGVPIAVGSDSQSVIDLWEEVRCVEYHARLQAESRNVLAAAADVEETSKVLWPMGFANGGRALGLPVGSLAPGMSADFITVDLRHPSLWGTSRATVATDALLSMSPDAVRDVWVGGERIIENREHPETREIAAEFGKLQARR
jgi:formimidoylglutamate deiminase